MKTKPITLATLVAALLLLNSCGEKEGALDKKCRIDIVTATERHYQNDQLYYSRDNYVDEDWHWDGKEAYRIDYQSDHPFSENIFYDNRHRIERTTIPAYAIRSEFSYDGRKLDHIDFYQNDRLFMTLSCIRGDKQLEEISYQYFEPQPDTALVAVIGRADPLAALLGDRVATMLQGQNAERISAQGKRGIKSLQVRYRLTWTDDNVTAITCIDADGTRNIALTYDDKRNPYRQLFDYRELTDPIFAFDMLSENNVTTIRMPYNKVDDQLFTYTYEYDGKLPNKRTLTYTYPAISETFEEVLYKYQKTQSITYLD